MAKTKKQAADEALDLARAFRAASDAVGDFLYPNWGTIKPADRVTLQGLEITLLNLATDLVTQAVDTVLAAGDESLKSLNEVTKVATDAIAKINTAKKVIKIATALIGLAATIPTGKVDAIASAANVLIEAAK